MTKIKLGSSQKAVFEWLKQHPRSTAEEVGNALYAKTSSCAEWQTDWPRARVSRSWASKLLNILQKKGCVEQVERGVYSVVPSMRVNEAE